MDATTTQSINLLNKLQQDFPQISFHPAKDFFWSPPDKAVYFIPDGDVAALLHEVAHGVLNHQRYTKAIQLIEMERQAWEEARILASRYNIALDDDNIEDHIDTYRDWLHARSTCPTCKATGIEEAKNVYHCLSCLKNWSVNEARTCQLRRYKIATK